MMKKEISLLCNILLSLLLISCHSEKKDIDSTNSLKIGFIPSTDVLPYIVAQQLNIYDSLKLNLKLIATESEEVRDSLFLQKTIDGSIISPTEVFIQQAQGIKIFPALINEGLYYIVASKDSSLVHPEQLKHKCLSVARGSITDFFADKILNNLEIGPDDISKPELNNESIRTQMLSNGQIDAAVLRDPYASNVLKKGCKILISSSSYPTPLSVTAFSDSILNNREEDIRKLIIGYNLAIEYMNKHPQEEWLEKAAPIAGLYGTCLKLPLYKKTEQLSATQIKEIILWLQEKGLLSKSYTTSNTYHPAISKIYSSIK